MAEPFHKTRQYDPKDKWLYDDEATSEQLAEQRVLAINGFGEPRMQMRPDIKFTCDGCGLANKCTLVFDSYNTDGDCLLSK